MWWKVFLKVPPLLVSSLVPMRCHRAGPLTFIKFIKMSVLLETAVCLSISNEITEFHQFPRSMSNPGLTSEAQLRYILQWFGEFSELQREDFLPVLAAVHGEKAEQLASVLASLSCQDKPMSLFQCRIKLFNEWYPTWNEEQKERLIKAVSEMDSDFGTKFKDVLTNGTEVNGDIKDAPNYIAEDCQPDQVDTNTEQLVVEESTEDGIVALENNPVEIVAAS